MGVPSVLRAELFQSSLSYKTECNPPPPAAASHPAGFNPHSVIKLSATRHHRRDRPPGTQFQSSLSYKTECNVRLLLAEREIFAVSILTQL